MQANVVVDASGHARITDFGHTRIVQNLDPPDDQNHSCRWTAPEVLRSDSAATKESDVFSFGMVVIEVGGD